MDRDTEIELPEVGAGLVIADRLGFSVRPDRLTEGGPRRNGQPTDVCGCHAADAWQRTAPLISSRMLAIAAASGEK